MAFDADGDPVVPLGSIGFRWGEQGQVEPGSSGARWRGTSLRLSLIDGDATEEVAFPYFGGAATNGFVATEHPDIVMRNVPVRTLHAEGRGDAGRDGV